MNHENRIFANKFVNLLKIKLIKFWKITANAIITHLPCYKCFITNSDMFALHEAHFLADIQNLNFLIREKV